MPRWCVLGVHELIHPIPLPRVVGACRGRFDGGAREETYAYDEAGRLVRWTQGDLVSTWLYEGERLSAFRQTDDGVLVEERIFDALGRPTQLTYHPGGSSGDLVRTAVELTWGDAGLLQTHTQWIHRDGRSWGNEATTYDPETGAPITRISVDKEGRIQRSATTFDAATGEFLTQVEAEGESTIGRRHCTAGGGDLPIGGEVRVDDQARLVYRQYEQSELFLAYDEAGRVVRRREVRDGVAQEESTAYDAESRVTCLQRHYTAWAIFDWPPLRDWGPYGAVPFCFGNCLYHDVPQPERAGERRTLVRYDEAGRMAHMALDVGADGRPEGALDFELAYDDAGRLVRESWLGMWSIEDAEYDYACD